jgi:hypothetical protein
VAKSLRDEHFLYRGHCVLGDYGLSGILKRLFVPGAMSLSCSVFGSTSEVDFVPSNASSLLILPLAMTTAFCDRRLNAEKTDLRRCLSRDIEYHA